MKRTIYEIISMKEQVEKQIAETKHRIFLAAGRENHAEVKALFEALRLLEDDYYKYMSQTVEVKPF